MLIGTIVYKSNGKMFKYNVEGVDNSVALFLTLTTQSYDSVLMMADALLTEVQDALWSRRVDIEMSKVKVETALSMSGSKKVKSPINTDFFCRLGSLIRYAKANCSKHNEEGYMGIDLVTEFEVNPVSRYIIKYPNSEEVLAKVKLNFGDIVRLELNTTDFEIFLEDDPALELSLFPSVRDGIIKGFRFDKEYLGFDVPAQITETSMTADGMYTCLDDIIKAHPDKEFSWLLEKDYKIVSDDNLEEICEYIKNWDGYVFYDTETTGLNITFKSRIGQGDQLVGVVLSVKYGESFFFPTQMKSIPNLCNGDHWYFMEHYMRPILEGKDLVAHNMSFDWKVGYIYDINCNIVHDTMALIKLTIGAERKNYPMGLKENAKLLLGRDSLELSDLLINNKWGENDIRFWDLPYELVKLYACADTDNTNGLLRYAMQADLLNKYNAKKIYEIEIAFSLAVAYQEFYGHRINIDNLSKMREDLGIEQHKLMDLMVSYVGHEFNPNSPQQLQTVMYKELGIPEQISRKTGRITTDKETLMKLAELTDAEDNIKYPFCDALKKYREMEGVRKIVDKFPEHMTEDGYIFSSVMQYGTTTGRVSINKPNYQSYNDPVKKNVIPRPGFWMFDTDYSSVEYRVLGNMVGNKAIIESFKDPDFDYHAYQAAHMYNIPYAAVTKKLRKAAKGINFGLPYGMGDESLGVRVFGEASPENTRKAASLRAAYFKGQEDIRDWFEFHRNRGVNEGFTETYFGRRRYYHRSDFSPNAIRRQAGNQVIQGCLGGGTRIFTDEFGIVRIKDVVGSRLNVWNGENWTTGDVMYSGKKQKCVVHFRGGQSIVCSPIHKFLVISSKGNGRWVECKDLKGTVTHRNPSRVRISDDFESASCIYSSEWAYKYRSLANNANNVFLDDIGDSFKIGVVLGRLASDGSYSIREDGGSYITQFIAEHEKCILPELLDCMENLNYTIPDVSLREERNEVVDRINVYSSSLVHEIIDLDIKHKVHDNIFMDTELLRGFIRGMFDGDGGVSGKSITLVFGVQYNFEPMCLDIQKALLFFGIRSRYRKYDDRYIIQIKTNDNQRFLSMIGFMNENKQSKGLTLECIEDEHVFGRCLVVESVEVTEEYIDMYDVCNTEGGYFVADGVITHNTAADIYKTAVGRVFKRICREGLLGKVLLTGFIHDELLGEVSNDINPGIWLKILREEFEVKITNQDGSPWCPLYMGFGYGMSWYEAKSVEIPIKMQWELVEKYGDKGFDTWNGNGREFCDTIPDLLREFEVRDIRNQILDTDSQGKEIKPTLNNQVLDCIKEDAKCYKKCIKGYLKDGESANSVIIANKDSIIKELDEKYHIQCLYLEGDEYKAEFMPSRSTQEALDQYCILHGVDRSLVNLLDIEEYTGEGNTGIAGDIIYDEDEEEGIDKLQRIKDTKIANLGMYVDVDEKTVTLLKVPVVYMDFIKNHVNRDGQGYQVFFKDVDSGQLYSTTAWLESNNINIIQEMYIKYFNSLRS